MNTNRHGANSVIAGQAVGGQFAASLKTEADRGALGETGPQTAVITTPPRKVELQLDRGFYESLSWPQELGRPSNEGFGTDEEGRFFSSYAFELTDGETYEVLATDMDGDVDFSGSLVWDSPNGSEVWNDHGIQITEQLRDVHSVLSSNAYRAGYAACEEDPELTHKVLAASLGRPRHNAEDAMPAAERSVARTKQNIVGWGDGEAPEEDIRDVMTDLAHYADQHDLDIHELFQSALAIQQDEKEHPHG